MAKSKLKARDDGTSAVRAPSFASQEQQDRAWRAVKNARAMHGQLQGFTRAILKDPAIRLEWTGMGASGLTDGKTIFLGVPIELGDIRQQAHGGANICGTRDPITLEQICEPCRILEGVQVTLFHEISHIAFGTFESLRDRDKAKIIERVLAEKPATPGTRIAKLQLKIEQLKKQGRLEYMPVCDLISPYLPLLLNCLEDARVNRAMYSVRTGTYPMFKAQAQGIFNKGIEEPDGSFRHWNEAADNTQIMIGVLCKAMGYDYRGWFKPEIETALNDTGLTMEVSKLATARSVASVYRAGFPILEHIRRLGFCLVDTDDQDDPPPVPVPQQPQDQEPSEPGDSEDQEPGEGGSIQSADSEPTEAESRPDSSSGPDTEPEPSEAENEPSPVENEASEPADDDGSGPSDDNGSDDEDGSSGGADEGSDDDGPCVEDHCPECGEYESECVCTDDDGDDDDLEDVDIELPDVPEDDEPNLGDLDLPERPWEDDSDSGDDGADSAPASLTPEQAAAEQEEAEEAIKQIGGHGEKPKTAEDKLLEGEVNRAIVQADLFDEPSSQCYGINVHRYDQHVVIKTVDGYGNPDEIDLSASSGWNKNAYARRFAGRDITCPESILGPALMKLRTVFAENRKDRREPRRRAGRVNARHLARVPTGEDRVFTKRHQPGKRDYFVVVGLDISSSTADGAIDVIKMAALAKAEMLSRLGIGFAVYAHTANTHLMPNGHRSGMSDIDIFVVKDVNDPWDTKARTALQELTPTHYNMDGHSLEFYRKAAERSNATDCLILFYTDGELNGIGDELHVFRREVEYCQKHGINLVGVEVGTDSLSNFGLESVSINDKEDVIEVVKELERRLSLKVQ